FFTMIGAEENIFTRGRFHTDGVEDRLQRNSGPAPVSRKTLGRATVAGTLEAGLEIGVAHLAQFLERERLRTIDQARYLQLVSCEIDLRMSVMLRREELILGCEWAINFAKVESSSLAGPSERRISEIGEGNHGFPLRQCGQRPFGYAEGTQSCYGQA